MGNIPAIRITTLTACAVVGVGGSLAFAIAAAQAQGDRRGGLCVVKYHDRNANGQRDPGEPPLSGWGFGVVDSAGKPVERQETGAQGRACFRRSVRGHFTVHEIMGRPGWRNTDPGTSPVTKNVVSVAGTVQPVLFGNCNLEADENCRPREVRPGRVCVLKYEDKNGNGVRDSGEPLLSGWQFVLLDASGKPLSQASSNGEGQRCFEAQVQPGTYEVREQLKSGWLNTDPGGTPPAKKVQVASAQTATVTFGNCRRDGDRPACRPPPPAPGRICIRKYEDLNGDGVRQNNEPWAVGWKFTIYNASNKVVTKTTSGPVEDHACESRMLPAGAYSVREDLPLPSGWKNTDPGAAQPLKGASVTSGKITYVIFGNQKIPSSDLTIRKEVSVDGMPYGQFGPPPNWLTTSFTVQVNCGGKTSTVNLSSANNYTATVKGVAAGTSCTVTEQPPAPLFGHPWMTSYHPSQTVQIGAQPQTVIVRNFQNTSGVSSPTHTKFVIEKTIPHALWNTGAHPLLEFTVNYWCSSFGGGGWKSAKISPYGPAGASALTSIDEIVPVGTTCQVEEDVAALPSLAGTQLQHCTWGAPEYRWEAVGQPTAIVAAKANLQLTAPQQKNILKIRNPLNC